MKPVYHWQAKRLVEQLEIFPFYIIHLVFITMFSQVSRLCRHIVSMTKITFLFFRNTITPLSSVEIAKQFLRCVLIQFAPNGLFAEFFRTPIEGKYLPAACSKN